MQCGALDADLEKQNTVMHPDADLENQDTEMHLMQTKETLTLLGADLEKQESDAS